MVHGHFEDKPATLTAGTYLHARIFDEGKEVLAVPTTAIVRSGETSSVFVLRNGNFVKIDVKVGNSDEEFTAIEELQLSEGDKLVTKGSYYINGSSGEDEGAHSH